MQKSCANGCCAKETRKKKEKIQYRKIKKSRNKVKEQPRALHQQQERVREEERERINIFNFEKLAAAAQRP